MENHIDTNREKRDGHDEIPSIRVPWEITYARTISCLELTISSLPMTDHPVRCSFFTEIEYVSEPLSRSHAEQVDKQERLDKIVTEHEIRTCLVDGKGPRLV